MKQVLFALAFICVASFKFFSGMAESGFAPIAIMYAAIFGSPQLIWILFLSVGSLSCGQITSASCTLVAFILSSLLFGSFPGVPRPSWGGEGHFEVPAALVFEGFISFLGIVAFVSAGRQKDEEVV